MVSRLTLLHKRYTYYETQTKKRHLQNNARDVFCRVNITKNLFVILLEPDGCFQNITL